VQARTSRVIVPNANISENCVTYAFLTVVMMKNFVVRDMVRFSLIDISSVLEESYLLDDTTYPRKCYSEL
jgi:hypothetical protein